MIAASAGKDYHLTQLAGANLLMSIAPVVQHWFVASMTTQGRSESRSQLIPGCTAAVNNAGIREGRYDRYG